MKVNWNKVIYIILCGIAIGLGSFASFLSLLANIDWLSYLLVSLTLFSGCLFVNVRRKYPLFLSNDSSK